MSPRPLLSLLWLSLAGIAVVAVRQNEASYSSHNPTGHPTTPSDVLQFKADGHVLGFAPDTLYVASGSHALRIEFVNSHKAAPIGTGATDGAQPAARLSQVTYANVWDGITLTYDAPGGAITRSTYRIEAQADPSNIRLRYNVPFVLQDDGSLRVNFSTGTLNESAPQAWQERDGKRVTVRIAFAPAANNELTFAVGDYDRTAPLFIDPTLTWNTFLGSTAQDEAFGLAVDALGNVYVAGYSTATWGSPISAHHGSFDAFLAKLDSNGNLTWNTFIGGTADEVATALAIDAAGNAYVTGYSTATWGAPLSAFSGGIYDAFVAKLDSNGTPLWNTFVGGGPDDRGNAIAVDVSGNIYVAGFSRASWGTPVRTSSGGPYEAFTAKLDSSGALIWNTFLGSDGTDEANAVAVDINGNVYVAGFSTATWGSPVRPYSGGHAAFVAKLDSSGTLTWNTFLGGGNDTSFGVAADASGNVYVAGSSQNTWESPVRAHSGHQDGYAAKLDSNGALIWNTFFGGGVVGDSSAANAVAVDGTGNVYVAGFSGATWGSPSRAYSGGDDAFAAQLDSNGTLTWNAFLGSGASEYGYALGLDSSGNVHVAGTGTANWGSPILPYNAGGLFDGLVAKVPVSNETPTPTPATSPTPTPTPSATPVPTPTPTPTPIPTPTPSFPGSFVIGDGNAVVGNRVTFWSAQWADANTLSGGAAPSGFKGFAGSTSPNPPSCGGAWISNPGNSSAPPASVPPFITVLVSSSMTKAGPTITGNIPQMVIVQTDPGYGPNPGQTGTGTVVAVVCH